MPEQRPESLPLEQNEPGKLIIGPGQECQLVASFEPPVRVSWLFAIILDKTNGLNIQDIEPTDFYGTGEVHKIYYSSSVRGQSDQGAIKEFIKSYTEIAENLPEPRTLHSNFPKPDRQ